MTNSQTLFRSILLNDLKGVGGMEPKALAEILLLRVHYGKGTGDFAEARDALLKEETDEQAKKLAVGKLLDEESTVADRKVSVATFEQIVGAVSAQGTIRTSLMMRDNGENAEITAEEWLMTFAANLVD